MVSNFLVGLREGLEASLVVGILVAHSVRSGRRDRLPALWAGVVVATALSLTAGALLTFTSRSLSNRTQEVFDAVMAFIAVGFVTVMVFWMRRAARHLKTDLHERLDNALTLGAAAVGLTAFAAVGREGLETAVFLWTAVQSTGRTAAPLAGGALGLAASVLLGYLIHRRSVALDLGRFFKVTGVALVVVAAGVLAYGVHDLQEAGLLPGGSQYAFDVRAVVPPDSWYGTLLKGTINFSPRPSVLETLAWSTYLLPVLALFLRPSRADAPASPAQ